MDLFNRVFHKLLVAFCYIVLFGSIFVIGVSADHGVNINTASLEELDTLPGVGPATAQSIINSRPYATIQEISKADGIGEPGSSSYNNIINHISVGDTSSQNHSNENVAVEELKPSSSLPGPEVGVLRLSISGDSTGVVGQPLEFRAETNSDKLTVSWVFGDGSKGYGSVVEHTYKYPGEYVVVASVSNAGKRASSRINVKVVSDSLQIIVSNSERVEIYNASSAEIDLHGRSLVLGDSRFDFPEDTIIKGGQKISYPSSVTGLVSSGASIALSKDISNSAIYRTKATVSEEDQKKISQIYDQILALQIKQQELKNREVRSEQDVESSLQLAAVVASIGTSTAESSKKESSGLFGVIKRFFGFK